MIKHNSESLDSFNSINSNSNKKLITTKRSIVSCLDEYKNNIKERSKDLKYHFQSSKKEHHDDTLNDILVSMMRKEERLLDFSRNRDSIIHNNLLKDIGNQRNSSKKQNYRNRNSRGSIQGRKSCLNSSMKIQKTNSVANSKKHLKRSLNMSSRMINESVMLNATGNNQSFYDRELIYLEKKKLDIEFRKNQKRAEELQINTNKPKISENSLKIVEEKFKAQKPLYMRTADIIEMKKLEEMQLIQRVKLQQVEKENKDVGKNIKKKKNLEKSYNKSIQGSPVTKWLKKMELYESLKEKHLEKLKTRIQAKKETDSSFSFQPVIDRTSDLLAKIKFSNDESNLNKSAFDRLHEEKEKHSMRRQKLMDDNKPSFSPFINSTKKYHHGSSHKTYLKYLTQNLNHKEKEVENGTNKKMEHNAIIGMNLFDSIPLRKNFKNVSVDYGINGLNNPDGTEKDVRYKINVRNTSAWHKEKENEIILKRKIPNTLKSMI